MREVWPDQFLEEGTLTRNVSTLRKALGESQDNHPLRNRESEFALLLPRFYSVLNAWTGSIEAARRAGISPAKAEARISVNIAVVSTPASMPFTS